MTENEYVGHKGERVYENRIHAIVLPCVLALPRLPIFGSLVVAVLVNYFDILVSICVHWRTCSVCFLPVPAVQDSCNVKLLPLLKAVLCSLNVLAMTELGYAS